MLKSLAPWLALVAALALPPLCFDRSWLLAYLAQTATLIVFALSYNLLLGQTGLLSFGHAVYAGFGAFAAAHVFNRFGVPLPLLPLIGGCFAVLAAIVFGAISTQRGGTAFAMITLGIGELVAASVWLVPGWFGGEGGVAIDRASGAALFGWTFGPLRQAYALIACWCVVSACAMFAFSRTPLCRLANAVRDNPVRAAAIGASPRRVRFTMLVVSAFFAGIAGVLSLVNVELASAESVGLARSTSVLVATVIGGTGSFFGPIAGAVLLTFFSVAVASVSAAWPMYLGLCFAWVIVAAPDGVAGFFTRMRTRPLRSTMYAMSSTLAFGAAVVVAVETLYARQADASALPHGVWWIALPCLALGVGLAWIDRRARGVR
ncbi:branched-chain amino acid ABC transporter permease [Caballeronia sp. LP006]|jgi:branched-chain amino acid transport system permease protein|uniref:branched-chain amino acid ABC transporter permease n=1 Tax=Caballeronia sp. LP006 TaxID=3038552 RepID=UPI0028616E6D|nr:branched-chain amino acid ABC transporter permease [Caballeronia sp. LP006]MDR5831678.1 branched-chain amino acid ABC transporter permease [Caballeronia sp. LP006]